MKKNMFINDNVFLNAAFIVSLSCLILSCSNTDIENDKLKTDNTNLPDNYCLMLHNMPDYEDYISIADENIIKKVPILEKIKTVMVYKLLECVTLVDSVYYVNITQQESYERGVSSDVYEEVCRNISDINSLIKEINKNPNETIELLDFRKYIQENKSREKKSPALKYAGVNQSGSITTFDNHWVYDYFYPEITKSKVEFTCSSNAAPIPVMSCMLEQWKNVRTGSKVGIMNAPVTIILQLYVSGSGVLAKIGYKTSSSKGGSAYWEAN